HSTTTPLPAERVVSTSVVGVAAADLGALIDLASGTVPAFAAAIAASLASIAAKLPSVVTMYSRPLKNCIENAEPQPVLSFHSRSPASLKQYTDEQLSPANTYLPSPAAAHENTAASHAYVLGSLPRLVNRW